MANGYEPGDYLGQFLNQLPQMYHAKKSADLQRERFEYYKNKDAQALEEKEKNKLYNRNVQSWTQMQQFAGQLPFGSRTGFLRKNIESLPPDFIESQGLGKFIENYQTLEDNELTEVSIYDNSMYEDSPDKMEQSLPFIHNPTRKRDVKNRIIKMKDAFGKQKNFDIDKLTPNQKNAYTALNDLLKEDEKLILEYSMAPESRRTDAGDKEYKEAGLRRVDLRNKIDPFLKLGAPVAFPEFSYSPESIKKITDDPDLVSAFWADPSNNLDEFIASRSKGLTLPVTPELTPTPEKKVVPKVEKGKEWAERDFDKNFDRDFAQWSNLESGSRTGKQDTLMKGLGKELIKRLEKLNEDEQSALIQSLSPTSVKQLRKLAEPENLHRFKKDHPRLQLMRKLDAIPPEGPIPPGKVWSKAHGHWSWHDSKGKH
jgi:hypothetical protein